MKWPGRTYDGVRTAQRFMLLCYLLQTIAQEFFFYLLPHHFFCLDQVERKFVSCCSNHCLGQSSLKLDEKRSLLPVRRQDPQLDLLERAKVLAGKGSSEQSGITLNQWSA